MSDHAATHGLAGRAPDELAGRLGGGVAAAARRPDTWPYAAEDLRTPAVGELVTVLYGVRRVQGITLGKVAETISLLADELAAHRPVMLAALFSPDRVPALLPDLAGRPGTDPVDGWLAACWLAEAAWDALQAPLTDPQYAEGDRELLVPLAARFRFLALTEPMRHRAVAGSPWLPPEYDADQPVTRAFGNARENDSWNLLVGRCREARQVWSGCLNAYQSHPYLSQASPQELGSEFLALAFSRPHGAPLRLSVQPLGEPARLTAEDGAVLDEVTEQHLLPRFDLRSVATLARYDDSPRRRRARLILGGAAAGAGLAAAGCAAGLLAVPATVLAFACYGLIISGVACFGSRWAAPWLLRLPAAAAVGVIALVTFLPSAWLRAPYDGGLAVLALAVAACGYLVVEARTHGVGGRALLRPLAVAGVGAVHALLVSLIGLVAVAPAFVPDGKALAAIWRHPGYGHAGMVLLLSTAWCLAVGVFSQVLWDDRPITAPLAHMSWRSGR